jgi:hypothetical protein
MAEDLRRFLASEPIRARRVGPLERAWNWARRRPALAASLAMVCGAAALVVALLVWTTRNAVRHAAAVATLAFRADGEEIVVATESGRLFRWPLPAPMPGKVEECEEQLRVRLGPTFQGGHAALLTPEAWKAR